MSGSASNPQWKQTSDCESKTSWNCLAMHMLWFALGDPRKALNVTAFQTRPASARLENGNECSAYLPRASHFRHANVWWPRAGAKYPLMTERMPRKSEVQYPFGLLIR
jgi:hypothetical protein